MSKPIQGLVEQSKFSNNTFQRAQTQYGGVQITVPSPPPPLWSSVSFQGAPPPPLAGSIQETSPLTSLRQVIGQEQSGDGEFVFRSETPRASYFNESSGLTSGGPSYGHYYWQNRGLKNEPQTEEDGFTDLPFIIHRPLRHGGQVYDKKRSGLQVDREVDEDLMKRYRQLQRDGYKFVPGAPPPKLPAPGVRVVLDPKNPQHIAVMQAASAKHGFDIKAYQREIKALGYDFEPEPTKPTIKPVIKGSSQIRQPVAVPQPRGYYLEGEVKPKKPGLLDLFNAAIQAR